MLRGRLLNNRQPHVRPECPLQTSRSLSEARRYISALAYSSIGRRVGACSSGATQQQVALDDRARDVAELAAVVLGVVAELRERSVAVDRVAGHQNSLVRDCKT